MLYNVVSGMNGLIPSTYPKFPPFARTMGRKEENLDRSCRYATVSQNGNEVF